MARDAAESFVSHFFSLLDAGESAFSSGGKAKRDQEDVPGSDAANGSPPLLSIEQRMALRTTLPLWVHLLSFRMEPAKQKLTRDGVKQGPQFKNYPHGDPFLTGSMADGWFALPHIAPQPTPWTVRQAAPCSTRRRIFESLQRRYKPLGQGSFTHDLMKALRERSCDHGQAVGRVEFVSVVKQLLADPSGSVTHGCEAGEDKQRPASQEREVETPVALLADVLFFEWCALAEGDTSFSSTHVPLRIVEADINAYNNTGSAVKTEEEEVTGADEEGSPCGASGSIVGSDTVSIGLLAGLACATPMASAMQQRVNVKFSSASRRHRNPGFGEENGDDGEWDSDNSSDQQERSRCSNTTSPTKDDVGAFIVKNTSVFNVPLASNVLSVYEVSNHSDSCGFEAPEPYVTAVHGESYYRRRELQWYIIGESKRHRNLLESKAKS
uniref:Uncharacterized protein TCIL3000_11_13710 n=1 Tax=Trypanosoma congolense (strain IL3000) TaxID=1068625 RepID=G0V2J3_TRYCI|nr:unnamed protein product [Trypanosoma congolense IL3000]